MTTATVEGATGKTPTMPEADIAMNTIKRRIASILSSPMGCAFFVYAREEGWSPADLADPSVSFLLAVDAVEEISIYYSGHAAKVAALRAQAPSLRPMVQATLENPGIAWWYAPLDLDNQIWVSHERLPPDTEKWQRRGGPLQNFRAYCTSTLVGEYTSEMFACGYTCCDFWGLLFQPDSRLHTWRIRFPARVRVYEVNDAADWHRLCVRYPARGVDDDRLVPNWGAVATEWDGVHLTFGGLLSCEQARYEDASGWSMNQFWQIERTWWLNGIATVSERWRDYEEM